VENLNKMKNIDQVCDEVIKSADSLTQKMIKLLNEHAKNNPMSDAIGIMAMGDVIVCIAEADRAKSEVLLAKLNAYHQLVSISSMEEGMTRHPNKEESADLH